MPQRRNRVAQLAVGHLECRKALDEKRVRGLDVESGRLIDLSTSKDRCKRFVMQRRHAEDSHAARQRGAPNLVRSLQRRLFSGDEVFA